MNTYLKSDQRDGTAWWVGLWSPDVDWVSTPASPLPSCVTLTSYFTPMCLDSLTCKMQILMAPTFKSCGKDWMRWYKQKALRIWPQIYNKLKNVNGVSIRRTQGQEHRAQTPFSCLWCQGHSISCQPGNFQPGCTVQAAGSRHMRLGQIPQGILLLCRCLV